MIRLSVRDADFEARFTALLSQARETTETVDRAVADIIADVRARGDAAVIDYTTRFDRLTLTADRLRISSAEIDAATAAIPADLAAALDLAATRIEAFHRAQLPQDLRMTDAAGLTLGMRWTALDAVGLYVPGGKAAYPSSVLMNAIPARAAGVSPHRHVRALAGRGAESAGARCGAARQALPRSIGSAGLKRWPPWRMGPRRSQPVDRIVGPGNAYVAEAKRQVFGRVGIDNIAGPSEVVVLADADNDPRRIAVDLLAQAEHDEAAQSILITDDAAFADAVAAAVLAELPSLPRAAIAGASWAGAWRGHRGARLVQAVGLVDRLAPEHLQLMVRDPELFSRGCGTPARCSWGLLPGGGRRLRRRSEPCAAHGPDRAVCLRVVGVRLPQAHHVRVRDPGGVGPGRAGGRGTGGGRRAAGAR